MNVAGPAANTRAGWSVQRRVLIIAALGLALLCYLVIHIGFRAVLNAATSVGWGGFGLLCLLSLGLFALLGPAWYVLLPRSLSRPVGVFIAARMVRDAASETLPFSQVGGMMLGVRAASVLGLPSRLAVASLIVDVTAELFAQLLYAAVGLTVLYARAAGNPLAHSLLRFFLIGLALATLVGGVFLVLQRHGVSWVTDELAGRVFPASVVYTASVAAGLREIHRSLLRIALSVTLHFGDWMASTVIVWIAFQMIGVRIDLGSVVVIESLVYAARSFTFFVPNAIGVQEAAYAALAPLVGVSKEFALAISLLKRARDIAIGIPVLLLWQAVESRHALARPPRDGGDRGLDPEG